MLTATRKVGPPGIYIQSLDVRFKKTAKTLKLPCSWYVFFFFHITSYIVLKTKFTVSTTCPWTIGDLSPLNKKMFVIVGQCWQRWVSACDGLSRLPLSSTCCHCLSHFTGPLFQLPSLRSKTHFCYLFTFPCRVA